MALEPFDRWIHCGNHFRAADTLVFAMLRDSEIGRTYINPDLPNEQPISINAPFEWWPWEGELRDWLADHDADPQIRLLHFAGHSGFSGMLARWFVAVPRNYAMEFKLAWH